MVGISQLARKGKCLILNYDLGLEHGPRDLNHEAIDPEKVFDIALEGGFSAIACNIGVAEKYYRGPFKSIPLIVKVNGASRLPHINPMSSQICSVERALKAGAKAIGFTIYDGSPNEPEMFEAFGKVCEQAHDYGLPVIVWMYPRGPGIQSMSNDVLAYSARIGLELGADIVKVKYNGDLDNLKWMVRAAGRSKVVVAGGRVQDELEFLEHVRDAMEAGCFGVAIGRNVWMRKKPFSVAKALRAIVYDGKSVPEAATHLK